MLRIFEAQNQIAEHLKRNEKRVPDILDRLVARASQSAGSTIARTVLSGAVKGYGVDGQPSELRSDGFKFVQHARKRRGYIASGYFWGRVANIYENFKNRKRVYLTRAAKRFFEQTSTFDSVMAEALQELAKE